jgi:hypothetical protein
VFFSQGLWWVFYSDGSNMLFRTSPDGLTWSGTVATNTFSKSSVTHSTYGYSFSITTYQNNIYYIVDSPGDPTHFYWGQGTLVNTAGVGSISWTYSDVKQSLGIFTEYVAGNPSITTDTTSCSSSVCLWATVPTLDAQLNWHILVYKWDGSWTLKQDIGSGAPYTGPKLYSQVLTTNSGIVVLFAVTGGATQINLLSADHTGLTWFYPVTQTTNKYQFALSQAISVPGSDNIYFAGVASDTTVQFWYYQWGGSTTQGLVTLTGPLTNGVNHTWHVSIASGAGNLAIFMGADKNVFVTTSTNSGATWTSLQIISSSENVVNGVAAYYSGSSFGLVWLNKDTGDYYVRFAQV